MPKDRMSSTFNAYKINKKKSAVTILNPILAIAYIGKSGGFLRPLFRIQAMGNVWKKKNVINVGKCG
jgi:hypothetical protein